MSADNQQERSELERLSEGYPFPCDICGSAPMEVKRDEKGTYYSCKVCNNEIAITGDKRDPVIKPYRGTKIV